MLERELLRFGKLASGFRSVELGCKSEKLKHVQSFGRQVSMFLTCPSQTLDVSFRVRDGEGHYMIYENTGSVRCFLCAVHQRAVCPHKPGEERAESGPVPAEGLGDTGAPMDDEPAEGAAPPAETEVEVSEGGQVGAQKSDRSAIGITTEETEGVEEVKESGSKKRGREIEKTGA